MSESYLEVWLTAKPFTNKTLRLAGMNKYQHDMFLTVCKMFISGFGETWDRKHFNNEYKTYKQTSIKFYGNKEWLRQQQKTIENEAFKVIMQDQYKSLRNNMRRLMPKKYRKSDTDLKEFSKYDEFVNGLAFFNITFIMDIKDEKPPTLQPFE